MIIDKAEVIITSPDRNFVTLKLTTDEGITGLGDATLNGRELAVVAYLRDHVVQLLAGRDASRIEDTWQFLYRSAYWRRGPVTMAAIESQYSSSSSRIAGFSTASSTVERPWRRPLYAINECAPLSIQSFRRSQGSTSSTN